METLNLGCGSKTSSASEMINIDWPFYLRVRNKFLMKMLAPSALNGERVTKYNSLLTNIKVWGLSQGVHFETDPVDVVYYLYLLEHLDVPVTDIFLLEWERVLKPASVHHIVVPELGILCSKYLKHIADCAINELEEVQHEPCIDSIISQYVRKKSHEASQQNPLGRFVENLLLSDARKRGKTHQWMYGGISARKLLKLGYKIVLQKDCHTNNIPN